MQKRMFTFGVALVQCFLLGSPIAFSAPFPFPDMEDSWFSYRDSVQFLVSRGVISGYPDGTFRPQETINRAEFLKLVFKGKSDVVPVQRRCFSDVNPDTWYAPYVCAAERRGIVQGYPDGTFRADEPVNTAEAIKMVLLAYDNVVEESSGEQWYISYTTYLDQLNILGAHSYIPWEHLTRERAADLITRLLRFEEDRQPANLSKGCGKVPPTVLPTSIPVDGRSREFLLTIPDAYVYHDPTPLLIAFHGRTNSNEQVRQYYRFDKEAEGYIIAYPAALNGAGSFHWSDGGDSPLKLRDFAFFDALVEQLASQYCIDMDRIFVAGHSLGGWFSNSVACARGDVVRASASMGGSSVITDCTGPSAAFIAHNPHDRLAPFSGSEATRNLRVGENSCSWDTRPALSSSLNCASHLQCVGGNTVAFCPHNQDVDSRGEYYPHNWPRETGAAIIEFFNSL